MTLLRQSSCAWREAAQRLRHDWLKNQCLILLDELLDTPAPQPSPSEFERIARWGDALADAYKLSIDAPYALSPARCIEQVKFGALSPDDNDNLAHLIEQNWRETFAIERQALDLRSSCARAITLLERILHYSSAKPEASLAEIPGLLRELRTEVDSIAAGLKHIDTGGQVL